MLNISILDDLSTFEYVDLINDILENWILYVVWNELCDCMLRLWILNIIFGVEKLVLWHVYGFWGCYHKLFWSILHWGMVTQSWEILERGALQLEFGTWLLESGTRLFESGIQLFESGIRLLEPGALGTCICIHILWCVCVCGFTWRDGDILLKNQWMGRGKA
jgi:hypothetical protein